MTTAVTTPRSPWSRSAGAATRRWVALPLLLALLGALAGLAVGSLARPQAEALLVVQTDAQDGAGMERAAENAAVELATSPVFDAAATATGTTTADLRARTQIATRPNSQIVSVTVSADDAATAVAQADAVARAGAEAGPDRLPSSLEQLTESTRDLIASGRLTNNSAERARVARLGDELAASQAQLITEANRLSVLQSAQAAAGAPAAPVLALLGAVAALLLGLGAALLLGARRGTVRSAHELAELYPDTAVIRPSDLRDVLEMEPNTSTVIVAGTGGTKLSRLTQSVRSSLADAAGKPVVVIENLSDAPRNESPNGHLTMVSTTLSETVMRRAKTDASSILIVPVLPKVTRLESVDGYASRLTERSYLLVDDQALEWE